MSREIEFRGIDIKTGLWVIGGIYTVADMAYIVTGDRSLTNRDGDMVGCVRVVPKTVGQYTGLKDKTGAEIYELDVVTVMNPKAGLFDEKAIIKFYANGWVIDMSSFYPHAKEGWCMLINGGMGITKIGNTHENPELLNQEIKERTIT